MVHPFLGRGAALPIIAEHPCGCNAAAAQKAHAMLRSSHSETIDIRGLRYHLRCWGTRAAAPRTLVMLHGWMDVSASFQFVADWLGDDWAVVAPDWRGYGLTSRAGGDSYWFPDYLADLDRILDHTSAGPALLSATAWAATWPCCTPASARSECAP
jgi:hypothetical protein